MKVIIWRLLAKEVKCAAKLAKTFKQGGWECLFDRVAMSDPKLLSDKECP